MTWIEDREAEIRQAKAEIHQSKQLIPQAYRMVESLRHELSRRPYTIDEHTAHDELCTKLWVTFHSRVEAEDTLRRARRTLEMHVLPP